MDRVLEGELMDDERQVAAYVTADFSVSNQIFADAVTSAVAAIRAPGSLGGVDLGCGPADALIRVARANAMLRLTGVDGSAPMIAHARRAVARAGVGDRVTLVEARLPVAVLEPGSCDLVISKDLLHHLPSPALLWLEARRLARPGAWVSVMDLMRPASPEAARRIVQDVAGDADPILKEDFYNSLLAAFTPEEVVAQLERAGLDLRVAPVSERHMLIDGCVT
jgi:SAM-dependent methyltransferase